MSGVEAEDEDESLVPLLEVSIGGLTRFRFVIGIADFVTTHEAVALALVWWCGDREDWTI